LGASYYEARENTAILTVRALAKKLADKHIPRVVANAEQVAETTAFASVHDMFSACDAALGGKGEVIN
jgi:hypothetical protein